MKKINTRAFTLVEMIVSITILSLIMISLIAVYVITSDVALRSEINRAMQENLKTATEQISEDLRNNKLQ
jgi:prepilin-type N-terminal cleavage/methylation domain-containing protein|tara:strand:- start:516 stop:725 length:210 start_codon:yes stop_codon:yes gene_type:complete